ncbi:hypothetical protein ETR37_18170 [Geobacillus sp. PK12]|nr:hypothetical protein ETR37_18170 [Geobacillus sp. PK12]
MAPSSEASRTGRRPKRSDSAPRTGAHRNCINAYSARVPDVPKAWRGFPVPEQSPWVGYTTPLSGPY